MIAAQYAYGVSLYSYSGEFGVTMTLDDCIDDVADLGATGLEILGEAHVEDYPDPSPQWVDAWFARLDRLGLTPTCLGSWVDTRRGGRPMTVDEARSQLETDLRLAARLGFRFLRPKLGVVTSDLEPDPVWVPATEQVLDLAAEKDVVLCPEIHWPTTIRSTAVDDYLAFIERTGTDHFGLLIDTGVFHSHLPPGRGGTRGRMGEGSLPLPDVPPVPVSDLEDVLDHVVYIQAKFYDIEDRDGRLHDDYIPWAEVLEVLRRRGWAGYLSSEYEGPYGVGRASDQIRRQHALLRTLSAE
ncbi:MAG TPA: TIM barrel protein [Lapillicoccus sp.]